MIYWKSIPKGVRYDRWNLKAYSLKGNGLFVFTPDGRRFQTCEASPRATSNTCVPLHRPGRSARLCKRSLHKLPGTTTLPWSKNRLIVEYALRDFKKPIGVAQWQTKIVRSLPKELRGSLPTIEELEKELGGTEETKGWAPYPLRPTTYALRLRVNPMRHALCAMQLAMAQKIWIFVILLFFWYIGANSGGGIKF